MKHQGPRLPGRRPRPAPRASGGSVQVGRSGEPSEGPSNSEAAGRVARVRVHLEVAHAEAPRAGIRLRRRRLAHHPDAALPPRGRRLPRPADRGRARGDPRVARPHRGALPGDRARGWSWSSFRRRRTSSPAASTISRRTLIEDLDDLHVEYVDLLGPVRSAPAQPYFEHPDGHPSAAGHEAIAGELDRILQEDLITARSR